MEYTVQNYFAQILSNKVYLKISKNILFLLVFIIHNFTDYLNIIF